VIRAAPGSHQIDCIMVHPMEQFASDFILRNEC
jgi:hypothetical protein